MSTLDRRHDRATSQSRRNHDSPPQQQQQQQPTSPFRHAYSEYRTVGRSNASKIPSPSHNSSARRRRSSQTGTLRGAFEALSRRNPSSMAENTTYTLGSPSREGSGRRHAVFGPSSPLSNPPDELIEAYRQIDDAGSLVDHDDLEGDNFSFGLDMIRRSHGRTSSSGSAGRDDGGLFATHDDADFLNDLTDESLRRSIVDHDQDAQRLRRATSANSPVFNKSVGMPALTSENLQRREEEAARDVAEEQEPVDEDYDRDPRLALNLPPRWGSRGTLQRNWLRTVTRRSESDTGRAPGNENPKDASPIKPKFDLESHVRVADRTTTEDQRTTGDRPTSRYSRYPLSDAHNRLASEQQEEKSAAGSPIPNTPITVYQNSTFNRRSPTRRDSHDLLRKLSRTESPGQHPSELRTPEAQKIPGTRIYDKTPVVTGAWIDTPVTERPARPDSISRDRGLSPAKKSTTLSSLLRNQTRIVEVSTADEEEPRKQTDLEIEKRQEREGQETRRDEAEKRGPVGQRGKEKASDHMDQKRENDRVAQPEKKLKDKKRPPLIKPDLPKSALEAVMQDFKADKESLDVGDDTLESLQEILNEQVNVVKPEAEDDAAYEKAVLEKLERVNTEKPDKFNLDNMNQKLVDLAQNITRVKQGLDGLGDQVSSIPSPKGSPTRRTHATEDDGRIYTVVPIPRLWKRTPSGRIRPTRLGWCVIVLFIWFWSESTLCDFYCHPLIAESCEGNCLLPDAPEFPFVLPTMLWRWSHLSSLLTPLWTVAIAFYRLNAQLLGLSDGYVDESPLHSLNLSGEIWVHGTRLAGFPVPTGISHATSNPPKYTPEVVPEINLGQDTGNGNWADENMDDDEYI
ncbi:hypothetical protein FE257_008044 [Aspergillus nanangensis]|uniref:Uncharacterized protein n=1 Tax=Aspergillus nanangensis TaxID=2582783 RepID=A0AAD4CP05_ASPNN|nr:hypothetical protein FE257_008044 [Aspergillus nanangensis]